MTGWKVSWGPLKTARDRSSGLRPRLHTDCTSSSGWAKGLTVGGVGAPSGLNSLPLPALFLVFVFI